MTKTRTVWTRVYYGTYRSELGEIFKAAPNCWATVFAGEGTSHDAYRTLADAKASFEYQPTTYR